MRRKIGFANGIPERTPKERAIKNAGDLAQVSDDRFAAARIEEEAAVGVVLIIKENIFGARFPDGLGQGGVLRAEPRAETNGGAVAIGEYNFDGDGPDAAFVENVVLLDGEMIDLILRIAGPGDVDLGHAAMANPHGGPRFERNSGHFLEGMDEIAPLRVGIKVFLEIKAQAIAKFCRAENERELLDDAGGFGIDDGAVGGLGVSKVFDVLVDRRCAFGGVDGVSRGLDGKIETLPDIFIGGEGGERLIGHVLREAFLEP